MISSLLARLADWWWQLTRGKGEDMTDEVKPGPIKLCCGWCDYETVIPEEMATHMLSLKHGVSAACVASSMDGAGFADIVRTLAELQANPTGGRPVDPDDLPEEVRAKLNEREETRAYRGQTHKVEGQWRKD